MNTSAVRLRDFGTMAEAQSELPKTHSFVNDITHSLPKQQRNQHSNRCSDHRPLTDDLVGVTKEDCEGFKELWGVLKKLGWFSYKRADIESSYAYSRPNGKNGEKGVDWYPCEVSLLNAVSCSCW